MLDFFMSLIGNVLGAASFSLASRQAKSHVISTLRNAIRLTDKHIADTRTDEFAGEDFIDVESTELSEAWSKVAAAIRPYDQQTAQTFEDKSDYWLNPYGFREDVRDGKRRFNYRFRLDEVKKDLIRIENGGI